MSTNLLLDSHPDTSRFLCFNNDAAFYYFALLTTFVCLYVMKQQAIFKIICLLLVINLPVFVSAQSDKTLITKIMGTVIDASTKIPIPFVNVYFAGSDVQTVTDFDGKYSIETKNAKDSLTAQYMGYVSRKLPVVKNKFQFIDFELQPQSFELTEAVILPGENPAEVLLKKVIQNKENNDIAFLEYYKYEAYTKIQIDANNYTEKFQNSLVMKPFKFVFENSDTSVINGKVFLPVFFSEAVSDIYYRRSPKSYKELIRASKVTGMENKTLSQFFGDTYLKINIYDNYNVLFEKNFVSPIANFGLSYYKYYLIDSNYINNRWCYHIMFKPRRSQELTYTGSLWIHDSTYAVVKVNMRAVKDANINIINEIVFDQEFTFVNDKYWMPIKDNIVADLNITENLSKVMGIYLHKKTSYQNFLVNLPADLSIYKLTDAISITDSAVKLSDDYWEKNRPEELTKEEKRIGKLVDTIQTLKMYKIYKGVSEALLGFGFNVGYIDIGPVLSAYSSNPVEGNRFRIGFRTSSKLSTNFQFITHVAYGDLDDKFKYGASFYYMFRKNPHTLAGVRYRNDIEQLGQSENAFSEDYFFRSVLARNRSANLTMAQDIMFFVENDWFMGFSNMLYLTYKKFYPISGESVFKYNDNQQVFTKNNITIAEIKLVTHFAYNEKFISGAFRRRSIETKYPVLDVAYVYGMKNVLNSDYEYHKIDISIKQKRINIGSIGWSRCSLNLGKIWGTLPYPLLKIHEGNETYMWDEHSFNTMNYYEFISDQYFSWYYTHHFDGLLFNKIPLLKKLRWREVVYFRGLIGSINNKNKNYSVFPENVYFLNKPYCETGFAIENIFKILRVDGIWRLNYLDHPHTRKFMVMVSLWFNF